MSKILLKAQQNYLENLRRDSDPLLIEIESYAREHKIPILDWLSADFLEQIVKIQRPRLVLEIGMAIGYSTYRIARNLRKKGIIEAIEKSEESLAIAKEFLERSGYTKKIVIHEGDALELMTNFNKRYDLIFLDADKEDYETLFYYSLVLLKKGGIIFIDNLLWQGYVASVKIPESHRDPTLRIRKFNELFISASGLNTTILPIGDGIGIGVKL